VALSVGNGLGPSEYQGLGRLVQQQMLFHYGRFIRIVTFRFFATLRATGRTDKVARYPCILQNLIVLT